jgi:hypothetical protein
MLGGVHAEVPAADAHVVHAEGVAPLPGHEP